MHNIKVLVTGAGGQLAKTIQELYLKNTLNIDFVFFNKEALDITNKKNLDAVFNKHKFDYCINCAAFTNVEQAEKTPETAYLINAEAVKNLAHVCKANNTILIHISTDYVFDGEKKEPYTIDDKPNPINEYGKSKLLGEHHIQEIMNHYFIVRTSWLYSKFGKNFMKTILSLSKNNKVINVVNDQFGTPTYAGDLAQFILIIIMKKSKKYGIYHLSNTGVTNWYNFAKEIINLSQGSKDTLKSITTKEFGPLAQRPMFNILDKSKTIGIFKISLSKWETILNKVIKEYNFNSSI